MARQAMKSLCLLLLASASSAKGREDRLPGEAPPATNDPGVGRLRGGGVGGNNAVAAASPPAAVDVRGVGAGASASGRGLLLHGAVPISAGGGGGAVLSFPLVPHAAHVERRRRELKGTGLEDDHAAALERAYEDESRFEGWPRRRRHLDDEEAEEEDGADRSPEVAPLFQGYGTHYLDLWIGHRTPQRQTVIVDTGSGITAFPCSGCPRVGCGDGYHTDSPFNEKESDTFEKVTECGECTMGRCKPTYGLDGKGGVTKTGGECKVTMSYQEGSSWEAYEAEDWAYAGGMHDEAVIPDEKQLQEQGETSEGMDGADPSMAPAYRFKLRFGCQTLLTGLFKTQLADGICGMENGESSFWYQMYQNYAIPSQTFALCFSRSSDHEADALKSGSGAGTLTLGGADDRLHVTPRLYAQNMEGRGWYTVYVERAYLRAGGGESAVAPEGFDPEKDLHQLNVDAKTINAGGIIVDSGTTDTYLPRSLSAAFKAAWKEATGSDPPEPKAKVTLSPQELVEMPTILLQLRASKRELPTDPLKADGADPAHFPGAAGGIDPLHPRDVLLAIPAMHYMEPRMGGGPGEYSMRVHFTEKSGGVLGANAMMGHDVVFEVDNGRVGFAESLCDYGKVRDSKENESR